MTMYLKSVKKAAIYHTKGTTFQQRELSFPTSQSYSKLAVMLAFQSTTREKDTDQISPISALGNYIALATMLRV
jgi:hypothetical protein